jgi:hypothetical protein
MIEAYARHNGHADLLRERIDGVTGQGVWASSGGGVCRTGRWGAPAAWRYVSPQPWLVSSKGGALARKGGLVAGLQC